MTDEPKGLYDILKEDGYIVTPMRTRCKVTHPNMPGEIYAPLELDEMGERKLRAAVVARMTKAREAAASAARAESGKATLGELMRRR